MIRKVVLVGSVFLLVGIFGIASISAQLRDRRGLLDEELPEYDLLPEFSLLNSAGEPFSLEDLTGKITIADFVFTSCSGPCPIMSSKMDELHEAFSANDNVQFVSISVNPEVDTPEVLTQYAASYEADLARWHFLTGENGAIQELAVGGFKVGSMDDILIHSTKFVLVDQDGRIRGYYTGTETPELIKLSRDIGRLLHAQ